MKYSCDVVKDLLPLYYDGVCSKESSEMVLKHLAECEDCKKILAHLDNHGIDDSVRQERDEVIEHYARKFKRKSLVAGICAALVFAVPILVCFICNLATAHALDWFFIVLTSLMVLASVTVVPFVATVKPAVCGICAFTVSLMLLLMTCCIYVGGDWFFIAAISGLLGLCVVFLPYVLSNLPQKGLLKWCKGLITMVVDTVLLYAVIMVCGFYTGGADYWHIALPITTVCVVFVWLLFLIIRYGGKDGLIKGGLCAIISGIFCGLIQDFTNWVVYGVWHISIFDANLLNWSPSYVVRDEPFLSIIDANVYLLCIICGGVIGVVLLVAGLIRRYRRREI